MKFKTQEEVIQSGVDLSLCDKVRGWRLCASEVTETHPCPDKTTSLKVYKGADNIFYIAGDYIGSMMNAYVERERNKDILLQTVFDKDTVQVVPKGVGMVGKLEVEYLSSLFCKYFDNSNLLSSVYTKSLHSVLELLLELNKQGKLVILTDTFKEEDYIKLASDIINFNEGPRKDYGLLWALSVAYLSLTAPSDTVKSE